MDDHQSLKARIRQFVDQRDWAQYHSPKSLSMALSVEAPERVEIFQWPTEEQSRQLDSANRVRGDARKYTEYPND